MLADMFAYFAEAENWLGDQGILIRVGQHLWYSFIAVVLGAVIAVPAGIYVGHTGRGQTLIVTAANSLRAIPSLGLMTLLVLFMGLGLLPPVLALVTLAVPPLLAGVYSGMRSVDRAVVDAAWAMGMARRQVIGVELRNALPGMVAGLRGAALQVIATAMIAAYVNLGGIGRYIFDGLALYDYGRVLVGAVLVTVLALTVDGLLAVVGRLVQPGAKAPSRRAAKTLRAGTV
ncbi:ABC transporter permease [Nesterenkonia populi]|uniref:ABC transporter permease n=1 Tax=Nesterenkonia populi TaxID=1591087 RepID=UPI0011BDAC29|nr:ABC transporter permease [Nesterenkonia populi]